MDLGTIGRGWWGLRMEQGMAKARGATMYLFTVVVRGGGSRADWSDGGKRATRTAMMEITNSGSTSVNALCCEDMGSQPVFLCKIEVWR